MVLYLSGRVVSWVSARAVHLVAAPADVVLPVPVLAVIPRTAEESAQLLQPIVLGSLQIRNDEKRPSLREGRVCDFFW